MTGDGTHAAPLVRQQTTTPGDRFSSAALLLLLLLLPLLQRLLCLRRLQCSCCRRVCVCVCVSCSRSLLLLLSTAPASLDFLCLLLIKGPGIWTASHRLARSSPFIDGNMLVPSTSRSMRHSPDDEAVGCEEQRQ